MQYLVGTDSVHTTAAICDYLEGRADADSSGDDIEVTVVAASDGGGEPSDRDAREALNVARVRLPFVDALRTEYREAPLAAVLPEAATEYDADEVIVGARGVGNDRGDGKNGEGGTDSRSVVDAILEETASPVVVVPAPDAKVE